MNTPAEGFIPQGSRGVWLLAWPSIITNLLYATGSIIAIKIVGQFGSDEIAAAVTGQRISFILQAVLSGVLAGTTALVARNWGAKNYDNASQFIVTTVQLVLVLSVLTSIFVYKYAYDISFFFALRGDALNYSSEYLRVLSPYFIFYGLGIALITALRAVGDVKTPLIIALIMNISGVFFMIVLANGYLGFKNYGYLGAALGNGISYLVGGVCIIVAWVFGLLSVRPKNYLGINFSQIKEILFVGYPAALEQVVFQFGITAFLILVSYYGTDAYAAYGIGVQILSFSFVIGFGFSIAGATLVGQHLGALDVNQARRSGWGAMRLSIISMSLFGLLISLFAEPLAYFMINDESVVRLTVLFIWLLGSMQPFMAIEFSLGGALRGAGDTKTPLMITLTCLVLIRVSLAGLFFYLSLPVEYIFASLLADYIVKGFLYTYSFRSGKWVHAIKST